MFMADWMMARRDSTLRGRPTRGRDGWELP
jgi:hypothetical protein